MNVNRCERYTSYCILNIHHFMLCWGKCANEICRVRANFIREIEQKHEHLSSNLFRLHRKIVVGTVSFVSVCFFLVLWIDNPKTVSHNELIKMKPDPKLLLITCVQEFQMKKKMTTADNRQFIAITMRFILLDFTATSHEKRSISGFLIIIMKYVQNEIDNNISLLIYLNAVQPADLRQNPKKSKMCGDCLRDYNFNRAFCQMQYCNFRRDTTSTLGKNKRANKFSQQLLHFILWLWTSPLALSLFIQFMGVRVWMVCLLLRRMQHESNS